MHKIKEKIAEHKAKKAMGTNEGPYDNEFGERHHAHGTHTSAVSTHEEVGEVVAERPVAVGVAEVGETDRVWNS